MARPMRAIAAPVPGQKFFAGGLRGFVFGDSVRNLHAANCTHAREVG